MNVTVEPCAQLPSAKSNSPCGNATSVREPAGGLAGSPLTGMKLLAVKVHPTPPPVNTAVMVPLPVGDGAVYDRATALGVTPIAVEGGPVPTVLVAVTASYRRSRS